MSDRISEWINRRYTRICVDCAQPFQTPTPAALRCPTCRKEHRAAYFRNRTRQNTRAQNKGIK